MGLLEVGFGGLGFVGAGLGCVEMAWPGLVWLELAGAACSLLGLAKTGWVCLFFCVFSCRVPYSFF